MTGKWWLNKTSNGGDAIRPRYKNGEVTYEHVKVQNHDNFDPSDAPVSQGGDAECPHCSVPMSAEEIREKFREDEFEFSVYGVNYKTDSGQTGFRGGKSIDQNALREAEKRIESVAFRVDKATEKTTSARAG